MDEREIFRHVDELIVEEHALRSNAQPDDAQRTRLRVLEEDLDQCWDLLRQRRARREAGTDPDAARLRSAAEVEGYLQ